MNQGLEWQVSNLELAKKLKELGCKQESLYYWHTIGGYVEVVRAEIVSQRVASAFTVAELGKMLPEQCHSGKTTSGTVAMNNGLWVSIFFDESKYPHKKEYADTEADARAKMLIYLLENKLIN